MLHLIRAQPVLDVAQKPAPRQSLSRRLAVNPDIEVVSFGKDPRVPVTDAGKVEGEINPLLRRSLDLERKALGKPGALRAQAPHLAACSIGANQKAGLISLAVSN